jgi:hypothetical protein
VSADSGEQELSVQVWRINRTFTPAVFYSWMELAVPCILLRDALQPSGDVLRRHVLEVVALDRVPRGSN